MASPEFGWANVFTFKNTWYLLFLFYKWVITARNKPCFLPTPVSLFLAALAFPSSHTLLHTLVCQSIVLYCTGGVPAKSI